MIPGVLVSLPAPLCTQQSPPITRAKSSVENFFPVLDLGEGEERGGEREVERCRRERGEVASTTGESTVVIERG